MAAVHRLAPDMPELMVVHGFDMIAALDQPFRFFRKPYFLCQIDGALEIDGGIFVQPLHIVRARVVHGVVGGFRQRFELRDLFDVTAHRR